MLRVGNGDALVGRRWVISLCILVLSCEAAAQVRVPTEWEAHAATWMQWPGRWERAMRPAFADIIDVVQGYEPSDRTTGHIDGTTRFIDKNTIAIADSGWGSETEGPLATACEAAGLKVVRIPCPGETDYMNWYVGNGFVAAMAFGDDDAAAKSQLETLFLGRDVFMLDASSLWKEGGGIHCVTNDQPIARTLLHRPPR